MVGGGIPLGRGGAPTLVCGCVCPLLLGGEKREGDSGMTEGGWGVVGHKGYGPLVFSARGWGLTARGPMHVALQEWGSDVT